MVHFMKCDVKTDFSGQETSESTSMEFFVPDFGLGNVVAVGQVCKYLAAVHA